MERYVRNDAVFGRTAEEGSALMGAASGNGAPDNNAANVRYERRIKETKSYIAMTML